jgi:hypothetical protein
VSWVLLRGRGAPALSWPPRGRRVEMVREGRRRDTRGKGSNSARPPGATVTPPKPAPAFEAMNAPRDSSWVRLRQPGSQGPCTAVCVEGRRNKICVSFGLSVGEVAGLEGMGRRGRPCLRKWVRWLRPSEAGRQVTTGAMQLPTYCHLHCEREDGPSECSGRARARGEAQHVQGGPDVGWRATRKRCAVAARIIRRRQHLTTWPDI